ncbi:Proteasome subunit alpha type-7-A [Capsicum baccatum]|uniref:Proteasome subunit alpha type-7-A n=1 Tax=Capsicum baccatum TaxID=33114 RepID=A0A2G2VMK3_CAPBA|nr:Proteasome subunit alpha type-7-A [Capsicum baccatum]
MRKGNTAVGVRGTDTVVLRVEKQSTPKLQNSARSVRKIVNLDNHIALACAGLKEDAQVLVNWAHIEYQSHRLTFEDPVTVEYITLVVMTKEHRIRQLKKAEIDTIVAKIEAEKAAAEAAKKARICYYLNMSLP